MNGVGKGLWYDNYDMLIRISGLYWYSVIFGFLCNYCRCIFVGVFFERLFGIYFFLVFMCGMLFGD